MGSKMNEKQRKLIELLKEMFQLNQTDLDFGIYRIMNQKADEINEFLEKDLIKSIKEAFSCNNNDSLQKELDELCTNITNAGMNPDDSPKVKDLKEKIAASSNSENDENEIYSYLTNFFSRYYKDGDFVSLRRYKKDTYAVPYEGEEVKLHWANSDQYYIKTSEFFRDYTFTVKDKKFHFKLVEADTEKNNNKAGSDKERRFVIDEELPVYENDGEIYIRFEYKPVGKTAQDKLNESALEVLAKLDNELLEPLKELAPTEKNKNRTILEKHLTDYTSRNSFDYFIHKDLNGFLSRELDFFIKNEILYIDDILESSTSKIESSLNKVKTFKTIANKVIAFLSQLEDFQKKLWLKKKFVIDTNYCITLDKIDESFYQEIFDNKEQLKEWKELFKVDIKSVEDLKEEKFLVLDTKFFDDKFKNKLLSEFDDIDEECDGVLISSENFTALNLLKDRYKEQLKAIYIDPPYNTNASEIIYMNGYKHSSWISLLENRLSLSTSFLQKEGIIQVAIDEEEQRFLNILLDNVYGSNNFLSAISIQHNPKGRDQEYIASSHEYLLTYAKNEEFASTNGFNLTGKDFESKYPLVDNEGRYRELPLKRTGSDSRRVDRPYMFYPFLINKHDNSLSLPTKEEYSKIFDSKTKTFDDDYVEGLKEKYQDEYIFVLPQNEKGEYLRWRWGFDNCINAIQNNILTVKNNTVYNKDRSNEKVKPKSFWYGDKYDASSKGTNLLKNIMDNKIFDYPKSVFAVMDAITITADNNSTILDFFAGSGTTGHATIKLNREDQGKRKYILVEMGEYFETVTKPRTQKVIYTDNWKNGTPQDKNGISQMFKYFKLESYEDSLNNLAFKNVDKDLFDHDVKEDYLLNYMLDYETNESLLNIDAFKTPFDYKLKIASSSAGETVETNVDLVETFNYLIGLKVRTREENKGFLVIQGQNLKEEKILIIWRNGQSNDELNSFFEKMDWTVYDREFDTIYINGDNNLANLKKDEDHFKVKLIEEEFKLRMFGE
jgi:adenine-specific DNA-methyltransferase